MLAVGAGNRKDQRIVADAVIQSAPRRHIRAGVGPADANAALVRSLPAIGAAPHPVVVVAQSHQADAVLPGQLDGAVHGAFRIQRAKAAVPIPALHRAKTRHTLGLGGGIDLALFQVIDHHREAVQAMAEHPRQAVLRKDLGGIVGTAGGKAVLTQHTLKFSQHCLIGNAHRFVLLVSGHRAPPQALGALFPGPLYLSPPRLSSVRSQKKKPAGKKPLFSVFLRSVPTKRPLPWRQGPCWFQVYFTVW